MTFALYLASGLPLLIGAALCAAAPAVDRLRGRQRGVAVALLIVGVVLIALSATPSPWPVVLAGFVSAIGWVTLRRRAKVRQRRAAGGCAILLAIAAICLAAVEISRAMTPRLAVSDARRLVVLGDSLSAGLGDGVETWPGRLAREHGIAVVNLASAGATTQGARRQAEAIPEDADVVAVLIGGNDYLQGRPAADFERDFEAVLAAAGRPGRRVVVFELPVPPLGNAYLAAQRRVAERHDAVMIPRWRLALALAAGGATSDGLHLSAAGQDAVARIAWEVIGPTFATNAGVARLAERPSLPGAADGAETAGEGRSRMDDGSSVAAADDESVSDSPAGSASGASLTADPPMAADDDGESAADPQTAPPGEAEARPLRLVTWNVQKCEGGVEAIVERLRAIDADVVCLQELVGPGEGSAVEDQARRIADELGLFVHSDCGPLDGSRVQCIAILSKTPLRDAEVLRTAEDRGYGIAARVKRREGAVRVVCVHLAGTWRLEAAHVTETTARREAECAALAEWIRRGAADERAEGPLVIAGDFNPVSAECVERLSRVMTCVEGIGATFPSSLPVPELDRVFCGEGLRVRGVRLDESTVSDHRAVVVEFGTATATE